MNIKEAKAEIQNAMVAYFSKDEFGNYLIPIEKQRPVFLVGPPGIGKTAIMEQISSELGVCLVSYSMTHHTRQSALGLPYIVTKNYGGKEYEVSEYTMSEIIASVYDMMEETGIREGILFLDEINCVSETLAPSMLQFLQYKVFGRHRVPDGWIVVTAGNPPEYNNSVREFDIVTWDRLKRIDVEPDFGVWKEYAYQKGIHPSILTYLEIKMGDFYKIETTVDGKSFVTARGWSDLSDMIRLYEKNGIKVGRSLISQYLQNKKIASEFAAYYSLFNKYKSDYQVESILTGTYDESIVERAKKAVLDERLALLGLLLDSMNSGFKEVCIFEDVMRELLSQFKKVKDKLPDSKESIDPLLEECVLNLKNRASKGTRGSSISDDTKTVLRRAIAVMEDNRAFISAGRFRNSLDAFTAVKTNYDDLVESLKKHIQTTGERLSNMFDFCERAFGNGQELLILVTELTIGKHSSQYISRYGCKQYFEHNKELLFYERRIELIKELEDLDL